ncbi:MAG: Holliday junction resolvase RecU [Bacilli bacterium]|jgi:recombination protein U
MINYPNGKKMSKKTPKKVVLTETSLANRGMKFEALINQSNAYYREIDRAVITKRPTPIRVVKVDYTKGAKIKEAFFEKQSTADYNGVYRGKYLDFEVKSTLSKTAFPLANITKHQIEHLEKVISHGGIAFFLINFVSHQEIYLLDAKFVIEVFKYGKRRSIPYAKIKEYGHLIEERLNPSLDYLSVVERLYF